MVGIKRRSFLFFFLKAIKQGHAKDKDTSVMEDELETLDAKTNQKLVGFYNNGVKIDLKLKEIKNEGCMLYSKFVIFGSFRITFSE